MAEGKSVTCDICGVEKRVVNRWWKVKEMSDHLRVHKAEAAVSQPYKNICGQSCVNRIIDRWMETGNLEKAEVVHPE
jgi:hypothetical protein